MKEDFRIIFLCFTVCIKMDFVTHCNQRCLDRLKQTTSIHLTKYQLLHLTPFRWQPPPDQPYVWPQLRRPISVEPEVSQNNKNNSNNNQNNNNQKNNNNKLIDEPARLQAGCTRRG